MAYPQGRRNMMLNMGAAPQQQQQYYGGNQVTNYDQPRMQGGGPGMQQGTPQDYEDHVIPNLAMPQGGPHRSRSRSPGATIGLGGISAAAQQQQQQPGQYYDNEPPTELRGPPSSRLVAQMVTDPALANAFGGQQRRSPTRDEQEASYQPVSYQPQQYTMRGGVQPNNYSSMRASPVVNLTPVNSPPLVDPYSGGGGGGSTGRRSGSPVYIDQIHPQPTSAFRNTHPSPYQSHSYRATSLSAVQGGQASGYQSGGGQSLPTVSPDSDYNGGYSSGGAGRDLPLAITDHQEEPAGANRRRKTGGFRAASKQAVESQQQQPSSRKKKKHQPVVEEEFEEEEEEEEEDEEVEEPAPVVTKKTRSIVQKAAPEAPTPPPQSTMISSPPATAPANTEVAPKSKKKQALQPTSPTKKGAAAGAKGKIVLSPQTKHSSSRRSSVASVGSDNPTGAGPHLAAKQMMDVDPRSNDRHKQREAAEKIRQQLLLDDTRRSASPGGRGALSPAQKERIIATAVKERDQEILALRTALQRVRLHSQGTPGKAGHPSAAATVKAAENYVARAKNGGAPPHTNGLPLISIPLYVNGAIPYYQGILNVLDHEKPMFGGRQWRQRYVVADDRGVVVFENQEDYRMHRYTKQVTSLLFRDCKFFVPHFRASSVVTSGDAESTYHKHAIDPELHYFGLVVKQGVGTDAETAGSASPDNPILLMRTSSEQEHQEWSHFVAKQFNIELYRDMFPSMFPEQKSRLLEGATMERLRRGLMHLEEEDEEEATPAPNPRSGSPNGKKTPNKQKIKKGGPGSPGSPPGSPQQVTADPSATGFDDEEDEGEPVPPPPSVTPPAGALKPTASAVGDDFIDPSEGVRFPVDTQDGTCNTDVQGIHRALAGTAAVCREQEVQTEDVAGLLSVEDQTRQAEMIENLTSPILARSKSQRDFETATAAVNNQLNRSGSFLEGGRPTSPLVRSASVFTNAGGGVGFSASEQHLNTSIGVGSAHARTVSQTSIADLGKSSSTIGGAVAGANQTQSLIDALQQVTAERDELDEEAVRLADELDVTQQYLETTREALAASTADIRAMKNSWRKNQSKLAAEAPLVYAGMDLSQPSVSITDAGIQTIPTTMLSGGGFEPPQQSQQYGTGAGRSGSPLTGGGYSSPTQGAPTHKRQSSSVQFEDQHSSQRDNTDASPGSTILHHTGASPSLGTTPTPSATARALAAAGITNSRGLPSGATPPRQQQLSAEEIHELIEERDILRTELLRQRREFNAGIADIAGRVIDDIDTMHDRYQEEVTNAVEGGDAPALPPLVMIQCQRSVVPNPAGAADSDFDDSHLEDGDSGGEGDGSELNGRRRHKDDGTMLVLPNSIEVNCAIDDEAMDLVETRGDRKRAGAGAGGGLSNNGPNSSLFPSRRGWTFHDLLSEALVKIDVEIIPFLGGGAGTKGRPGRLFAPSHRSGSQMSGGGGRVSRSGSIGSTATSMGNKSSAFSVTSASRGGVTTNFNLQGSSGIQSNNYYPSTAAAKRLVMRGPSVRKDWHPNTGHPVIPHTAAKRSSSVH